MDLPPPSYVAGDSKQQSNGSTKPGSDVPLSVSALLESTKALTDCLQSWSVGRTSDEEVSDVYVTVGTKFNLMVTAFMNVGIDMSELYSIPVELRHHLENCLGEVASPAVLAQHMPGIKTTMYRLLNGLKGKQDAYWKAVGGRSRQSTGSLR